VSGADIARESLSSVLHEPACLSMNHQLASANGIVPATLSDMKTGIPKRWTFQVARSRWTGATTGAMLWTSNTGGEVHSSPAVANGVI